MIPGTSPGGIPTVPQATGVLLQPAPEFEQFGGSQLALYDWSGASGAVGGYMPGMAQSGNKLTSYLYVGNNPAGFAGRCLGANGELQIYNDPEYISGANPFGYDLVGGTFSISTMAMPGGVSPTLSDNKPYIGGCLTTQNCFQATYGYWEACIQGPLSGATGTWLTFWLLPVANTTLNAGQTPEMDIFECENVRINSDGSVEYAITEHWRTLYANATASLSGASGTLTISGLTGGGGTVPNGTVVSQYGTPITGAISVDGSGNGTYTVAGGAAYSNVAVDLITVGKTTLVPGRSTAGGPGALSDTNFHVWGCYIDATTISIFLDGVQIYTGANSGSMAFTDSHYAVLSLAAGGTNLQGQPVSSLSPTNQTANFKWLRHYALA